MPIKNLHDKPFSQSTVAKLEIFEDYAEAWIPTFVMSGTARLAIFDFFAGTGYDKNGIAGSPIRILEKIKTHLDSIRQKNVTIVLYFNEYEPSRAKQDKFESLKVACRNVLIENPDLAAVVDVRFHNEDFESLFPKLLPDINKYPSLIYLDQNGIKFTSDRYLLEFDKMRQTDFLYFVSSSYLWRFGESDEFTTHLDLDISEIKKGRYEFIHRNIIEELRRRLPEDTKLKLYPFSLKKESNIYGIVFGASHPRAVDNFLGIAWKRNGVNGEANFDIDDDVSKAQATLFEPQPLTKIETFQRNVRTRVLSGEITNNFELLNFAFEEGHLGSHAGEVLRTMKKGGLIHFEGTSPLVTYENVYKNKRKLDYIIKNDATK